MSLPRTSTVTVSSKGWVVIPAPLRRKMNIKPGMRVLVDEVEGKIVLTPQADDPVESLFGKLAGGESLTKELLAEKALERGREKAKIHS